ncbi:carboxymuconolactone decarboxylase family protein [Branchiibius cervicis]|uniref:Carboxymuconolactone decarboxylase family protein n=1 Tax=Branchiibius cervicis TaxID=908252 RepID=A0ABW2AY63_9MICO
MDVTAGERTLRLLQDQETTSGWRASVDAVAPGMDQWIVGALFGGPYQRPGLSLRDRQLINLGALTAMGGVEPQLVGHVRTCLRIGMTRQEVGEVFAHLTPYVGTPRALAGMRAAAQAFEDANATHEAARHDG